MEDMLNMNTSLYEVIYNLFHIALKHSDFATKLYELQCTWNNPPGIIELLIFGT